MPLNERKQTKPNTFLIFNIYSTIFVSIAENLDIILYIFFH